MRLKLSQPGLTRSHVLATALIAASVAAWPSAQAPATGSRQANLKVTAEVIANCVIRATDLAFGSYDPVGANATAPLTAAAQIFMRCTPGTLPHLELDNGQHGQAGTRNMQSGSTLLAYDIYSAPNYAVAIHNFRFAFNFSNRPFADTREHSMAVYGRIPAGQNVPAGAYTDQVVVTTYF